MPLEKITIPPPENHSQFSLRELLNYYLRAIDGQVSQLKDALDVELPEVLSDETVKSWLREQNFSLPKKKNREALLLVVTDNPFSKEWHNAFITCFARKGLSQKDFNDKQKTVIINSVQQALQAHNLWIISQYKKSMMGEKFSIESIYVPIPLIKYSTEYETVIKEHTTLLKELISHTENINSINWIFIKGGPGSGKSVEALHLSQSLAKNKKKASIFISLNRTNFKLSINLDDLPSIIDDRFSPSSFLEIFRLSSFKHAYLVLDGLDEIGTNNRTVQDKIHEIIKEIQTSILEIEAFNKTVQVIVFGRDTITEIAAKNFSTTNVLYSMANLSGYLGSTKHKNNTYGTDLRPLWWKKFLKARNYKNHWPLPDFLTDSDNNLYELGKEPLLAYLICRTALPIGYSIESTKDITHTVNTLTKDKNRNKIYEEIINEIRTAKTWNQNKAHSSLSFEQYFIVLQHMALATWHEGNSRTATISSIKSHIKDTEVLHSFEKLISKYEEIDTVNLITAFYYRIHPSNKNILEYEFEFTHKTFSEYLLATFLFDQFEEMIDLSSSEAPTEIQIKKQIRWLEMVAAGPETEEIAKFILDEAVIRYEQRPFEKWCQAFNLIRQITNLNSISIKDAMNWSVSPGTLTFLQRGASLLFFFWGAINKANFLDTKHKYLFDTGEGINTYDLKLIQPPLGSESDLLEDEVDFINDMVDITETNPPLFLGYSISGIEFNTEDLTGFFVNGGEIIGLDIIKSILIHSSWLSLSLTNTLFDTVNCTQSRFVDVAWSNSKISHGNFSHSIFINSEFNNVVFVDTIIQRGEFNECLFKKCNFKKVLFDFSLIKNCTFKNCRFLEISLHHLLEVNTTFENCTFIKCDAANASLSSKNVINCEKKLQK